MGASPARKGSRRVATGALATPGWKVAAGDVDLHPSIHRARRGQRLPRAFLIAQPHSLPVAQPVSFLPENSRPLVCQGFPTWFAGSSASRAAQLPTCPSGEEWLRLYQTSGNIELMQSQSQHKTGREGSALSPPARRLLQPALFCLEIRQPETLVILSAPEENS